MSNPFGSEPRGDSAFGSGFGFGGGFAAAGFSTADESFSSFASRTAILSSRSFLVGFLVDFLAIAGPAGGGFICILVGRAGRHA